MKKLMFMAALCCATFAAQAVQVTVTASGVQNYGKTALYSGNVTIYIPYQGGFSQYSTTMSDGAFTYVADHTYGTLSPFGANAGYMMSYGDSSYNYSFVSTSVSVTDATTSIDFGNGGSWTATPVPEPTSGLLMLLGLAGLALKRKRA